MDSKKHLVFGIILLIGFMMIQSVVFATSNEFFQTRSRFLDRIVDAEKALESSRGFKIIFENRTCLELIRKEFKDFCCANWRNVVLVVEERIPTKEEFAASKDIEKTVEKYKAIMDRARTMEAVFCDLSSQVQDEPELKEKYLCAQAAYNQAKTRFELAQLLHKKEERDCMSKKHE